MTKTSKQRSLTPIVVGLIVTVVCVIASLHEAAAVCVNGRCY